MKRGIKATRQPGFIFARLEVTQKAVQKKTGGPEIEKNQTATRQARKRLDRRRKPHLRERQKESDQPGPTLNR
jgi:hypothetical protein